MLDDLDRFQRIFAELASDLAGGTGALDQRIEVRTGDELEELVKQFNLLSAELSESYSQMRQRQEQLERRVGPPLPAQRGPDLKEVL